MRDSVSKFTAEALTIHLKHVVSSVIESADVVRDLGVMLNAQLSMHEHVYIYILIYLKQLTSASFICAGCVLYVGYSVVTLPFGWSSLVWPCDWITVMLCLRIFRSLLWHRYNKLLGEWPASSRPCYAGTQRTSLVADSSTD